MLVSGSLRWQQMNESVSLCLFDEPASDFRRWDRASIIFAEEPVAITSKQAIEKISCGSGDYVGDQKQFPPSAEIAGDFQGSR